MRKNTMNVTMRTSLSGGYYLFTLLSAEDKMRYLPELPRKVGFDCEFTEGW
jgi:hypothetical protein